MIYADTVGDLGYAEELGNYAEYSGGPNQQVGAAWASIGRLDSSAARVGLGRRQLHIQVLIGTDSHPPINQYCSPPLLLQETYNYAKTLLEAATAYPG